MPPRLDLVVVGAGSTGAALAAMAARAGMRVRVVERRAVDEGGARWVNDVPRWCFTAARFSEPPDHVVAGPREGFAATLFAGWGPHKLEVGTPAVLPIRHARARRVAAR